MLDDYTEGFDAGGDGSPYPTIDQILMAADAVDTGAPPALNLGSPQSIEGFLKAQEGKCGSAMVGDFRLVARRVVPNRSAQRSALCAMAETLESILTDFDRIEHAGPSGIVVLFAAQEPESARKTTGDILRQISRRLRKDPETAQYSARGFCFDYAPYLSDSGTLDVKTVRKKAEEVVVKMMRLTNPPAKDKSAVALQFTPIVVPRKRMMIGYAAEPLQQAGFDSSDPKTRLLDPDIKLTLDTLTALSSILEKRRDNPNVILTVPISTGILRDERHRNALDVLLDQLPDHTKRRIILNVDLSNPMSDLVPIDALADAFAGRGRGLFLSIPLDFIDFEQAKDNAIQALCPVLPRSYKDGVKDRAMLRRFTERCRDHGMKSAWFPRTGSELSARAILSARFDMFSYPAMLPATESPNPVYKRRALPGSTLSSVLSSARSKASAIQPSR